MRGEFDHRREVARDVELAGDPEGEAELIATGIPSAASMCYDSDANQLVIPMNANNALAFVPLD